MYWEIDLSKLISSERESITTAYSVSTIRESCVIGSTCCSECTVSVIISIDVIGVCTSEVEVSKTSGFGVHHLHGNDVCTTLLDGDSLVNTILEVCLTIVDLDFILAFSALTCKHRECSQLVNSFVNGRPARERKV